MMSSSGKTCIYQRIYEAVLLRKKKSLQTGKQKLTRTKKNGRYEMSISF